MSKSTGRSECGAVRNHRFLPLGALLLAAAVALALGACGGDDQVSASPVTVRMTEFSFLPAELNLPRNSRVNVVNEGHVAHTWIVKDAGAGTPDLQPGQSIIVDLRGIAAGTYALYCDQPGHSAAGQSGILTITG